MQIPKHEDIRLPALELLTENDALKLKEFEQPLVNKMGLSQEEAELIYESGNGRVFYDRISWALSYMNMAGLVQKPKRGTYEITDKGREFLTNPEKIHTYITEQVDKREPTKRVKVEQVATPSSELTPLAQLYDSSSKIKTSVYAEIIDVILN